MKISKPVVFSLILFFGSANLSWAHDASLDRPVAQAKQVLNEIMSTPDGSIPEELLAKCKAIVIYPSLIKGGFIIGARYGKGVALRRDKKTGKWGPVSFSTLTGVSVGFQAGVQATDLILVVLNNNGLAGILSSRFTLGGDMAVSVGPVGRTTEIATDLSLKAGILSYSRSRGLFAGVALNGAVVTPDNRANTAYYGRPVSARDILLESKVPVQPSSKELADTLNDYSSRWEKRLQANLSKAQSTKPRNKRR